MKVGAYTLLFFFITLNLSFYVLHEFQVMPFYQEELETPASIQAETWSTLVSAIGILIGGMTISAVFRQYVLGTTLTLVMAGVSLIFPVLKWVILGFPTFLLRIGVPLGIIAVISTIYSFVFFWFLIGVVSQRYMAES